MEQSRSLKINELESWVQDLSLKIKSPTIVLLSGELGAGKSLLIKKIVKSLGGTGSHSPTYSLINEYETHTELKLYHVDLYRLKNDEDLESIGFWDLFDNSDTVVFIEWGDRLNKEALPLGWNKISINISKPQDDNLRTYKVIELAPFGVDR